MASRNTHPHEATKRSLHYDVEAATPAALLDVSWAYLGPAAQRAGLPARDGAFEQQRPHGAGSTSPRSGAPKRALAPTAWPPLVLSGSHALSRAVRGGSPASRPSPRPAPPRMRVRRDGLRVVSHPLAMLPGVALGAALRLDLHPVKDGLVYVSRCLELRELGDDVKGPVHTGVIPASRLDAFWPIVMQGHPADSPVIVRLRSDEDAELLSLLRLLAPATTPVVSYRLDESPVGSQRSSYLLPDLDTEEVLRRGAERVSVEDLQQRSAEEEALRRSSVVFLSRRRADRFVRRNLPALVHNLAFTDATDTDEVFVDGSVLRGTRTGGAAAVTPGGLWAAQPMPGATLPLEVELEALVLGHVVTAWGAAPGSAVTIRSDSRAALALLRDADRERLTLGGARGERIRRSLRRLLAAVDLARAADVQVRTTWVKGHAGTAGNELADDLARSAARNSAVGLGEGDLQRRMDHVVRLSGEAGAWTGS